MIIKKEKINQLNNIELIENGFKKVNELENKNFFLISNTLMIIIFIIGLYNVLKNGDEKFAILYFLITIVSTVIHELLHGLGFEGGLKSQSTVLSFNLRKGSICCSYNGEMYKSRMLISLMYPLIILTIIPTIIMWLDSYSYILSSIIIINLALSIGDVLNFFIILKNTPKNSIIINKYHNNYYKEE